jgi:outer membrane protein OmpA-like peptidoglycan-associated protein
MRRTTRWLRYRPPAELINARQAYQHASAGQAAQLVPAELHKAKVALDIAEKSFQDDPKSFRTRDLAYVADRKAKLAEALATTVAGNATTAKANQDYQTTQTEIVKNTKEDLAAEQKARLDTEAKRVQDSTNAATETVRVQAANVAEARRIQDSTNAAAEALRIKDSTNAAQLASEKQKTDTVFVLVKGKTVVLRGVNFEFNKATLTKDSERILWRACNAMVANSDVRVVITGYTDNVGSQKFNQALSLKRAQAVKNWLVKKGIASNRMRTVGRGENEPMASNDTDAGRADNRRIEFYVEK